MGQNTNDFIPAQITHHVDKLMHEHVGGRCYAVVELSYWLQSQEMKIDECFRLGPECRVQYDCGCWKSDHRGCDSVPIARNNGSHNTNGFLDERW